MHHSGILILTQHVSSLCHGEIVKNIVAGVKKMVSSTLYVHVANTNPCKPTSELFKEPYKQLSQLLRTESSSLPFQNEERQFAFDMFPFLYKFYDETSNQCRELDVNILLHGVGYHHNSSCRLQKEIHCIIADCTSKVLKRAEVNSIFQRFVQTFYLNDVAFSNLPLISISDSLSEQIACSQSPTSFETVTSKGSVVIGGTYDHIHSGHKVLLSESILLAHKRLLIGLTDGVMLDRKTLSDLIKPWETRRQKLIDFICDIAHFQPLNVRDQANATSSRKAILQIEQITDPVGPAGTDEDIQCIVVSKETERGGQFVNQTRSENGLNKLQVHVVGQGSLVDDQHGSVSPTKETKSSSSTLRCESLGILRKSPNTTDFFDLRGAYIIGLTGGIASGKSSICKHLQSHGAVIIDCDKLGHVAYEPGTTAFKKVVDCFGADVVSQEGSIDRKVLASRVFTSDSREKNLNLANLNAIVWPEIERHARRKIAEAVKNNRENKHKKLVCVLDAAVLLEAGWDAFVNEVWVCIIPKQEAISRMGERDGRSKEEAEKRIEAQMSGRERVALSHVVLSTLWEPSITKAQVAKAWTLLQNRISTDEHVNKL